MFESLQTKNKWKQLFWIVAGVNAGVVIGIVWLIFLPSSDINMPPIQELNEKRSEFTVSSTKQNLNQLMNSYLKTLPKNASAYTVSLGEDVQLQGFIDAFGKKIPLIATFEPIVQKNGDLILRQKSIMIGKLHLPKRAVLEYIRDNYHMPEWVRVNVDRENIYIAVTKMKTKSDFKIKVKEFDFKQNKLTFIILVPNKTFGF
ncbi:YpmS family protein [Aneurinibacillus aneurinilyticus]|uniref:YpmS family protein n=1 Tax=Aneurinibacillus aneurinilyticus TaxID=1391 RepID=A0A848CRM9_ANEAE|nr:YpmS family protein [Aneurinibacillus aneurinilyticus]MED0670695.1 YpmS family protein [Aneurinibacillus aneurinilyticus]NMF00135.1 YpmS family protein [Aneurinibacillus aneurinilyticus]